MTGAKSPMQCAGINRHEAGNERVLRERSSESALASSFALHTARCVAKRKQGSGGLGIELRKYAISADSVLSVGRQHGGRKRSQRPLGAA